LLALNGLYFAGSAGSFENSTAPAWQSHYRLWGILALIIPGVLVGFVANRKRWLGGVIAGVIGCLASAAVIGIVLAMKQSLGVDSWLGLVLLISIICLACGTFAWLTGVARDRWSPNKSLERTREG
jgi:peptidoglycan/LPS O-acetylase OafA/YrhL